MKSSNAFLIVGALGVGLYIALRPSTAKGIGQSSTQAAGLGVAGMTQNLGTQPVNAGAGSEAGGIIAGLGSALAGLSGAFKNSGGSVDPKSGNGSPGLGTMAGGGLAGWSVNLDSKITEAGTLDSSVTDLSLGAGWEGSSFSFGSGDYSVPSYTSDYTAGSTGRATGESLGLGDYDLSVPSSINDL